MQTHAACPATSTLLTLVLLLATGCGGHTSPPAPEPAPSYALSDASTAAAPAVGLRPGDAMRVEIWREPDLSGDFTVNSSGMIVFPLLGERRVTGVSPDALEQQLAVDYREYLENPSVDVTVLRRVSILGEVRNPGLYPVDATFTLTDALALAGGVGPRGNKNDIRLIRNGQVVRQSLDAATVVGASPIQSGDQILVGQRPWLSRNLPLATAGLGALTSITIALFLR